MLPSFDQTITFRSSRDYHRLVVLTHIMAVIMLLRSSLPLLMIASIFLLFIVFARHISHMRWPMKDCHQLSYHPGYWLLYKEDGSRWKYERVTVRFDGGIFFLLTLSGMSPKKTLVIFHDQITISQYRALKLTS